MRILRTARMSSTRQMKTVVSTINDIPRELITGIMAQVGASSMTDLFNAKLSCKSFYGPGEDKLVYQQVSLDKLPFVSWRPSSVEQQVFLRRCEECKHPEIMYRQGVVDYFSKRDLDSAYKRLENAMMLGHVGSLYLTCIILLLEGDDEKIKLGIKLLGCMTKSKYWRTKFRRCRKSLTKMLKIMWINYPHARRVPKCCQIEVNHGTRFGWDGEIDSTQCEACNADRELQFICSYLPQ